MKDAEQPKSEFEEDEQIQITDLDPEGSSLRRRARLVRALLSKSVAMAWVRYSLVSLLLLVLLSTIFIEAHPFTQTGASPTPVPPTPTAQPASFGIAFADNRVYIQSANGTVSAYQENSGHVLWRVKLPAQTFFNADDQLLYCYFVTPQHQGSLEALDARDGRVAWRRAMPALSPYGRNGFPLALRMDNDALYVLLPDSLYALRRSNGQTLWMNSYAPPISPSAEGVVVQNGIVELQAPGGIVHILDGDTGKELFHIQTGGGDFLPQITIDGQQLYVLPAPGSPPGDTDIQVYHFPNGKHLWSASFPDENGRVIEQMSMIYLINQTTLTVLRGSDGQKLWTYKVQASGASLEELLGTDFFGPVEEHGLLYLHMHDENGEILAAIRASDGQSVWSTRITAFGQQPNEPNLFEPAASFANGMIFLTSFPGGDPAGPGSGQPMLIYALDASTGHVLWHISEAPGRLTIRGNKFYLEQDNGQVDAYRASDHQHLWSYQTPPAKRFSIANYWPATSDVLVLFDVQTDYESFIVLNNANGKLLWHYP